MLGGSQGNIMNVKRTKMVDKNASYQDQQAKQEERKL